MKFEEALAELRKGKKIRHPTMPKDEYYTAGVVDLFMNIQMVRIKDGERYDPAWKLSFKEFSHLFDKYPELREKITYPTINLLLLTHDDWEVVE